MGASSRKSLSIFKQLLKQKRLETGFTVLEAVVVVGVILALAVGGFMAYGSITQNAKRAAVRAAASDVYTAARIAILAGMGDTPEGIAREWNDSQQKVTVEAKPSLGDPEDVCIFAFYNSEPEINTEFGACVANTETPPDSEDDEDNSDLVFYRSYSKNNFRQAATLAENLPGLSSQPTQTGREISELTLHNGRLYVGYGDYTVNTGPIDLYSYDVNSGDSQLEISVPTEDIDVIREINGKLYAPYIDPKAEWNVPVGYSTNETGIWQNREFTPMIHNYDMATTNGTNLFMAGSLQEAGKYNAVIWYSADGKTNWQIIKRQSSPTSRGELDRFYWLQAIDGKLYASADINGQRTLETWENGTWKSINLAPEAAKALLITEADRIIGIGDKLITMNPHTTLPGETEIANAIYSISENRVLAPSETTVDLNGGNTYFVDFQKVGSTLYGMTNGSQIYSTTDGVNWKYLVSSSVIGSNFAIDPINRKVYIGRSEASTQNDNGIYVVSWPAAENSPPEITVPKEKVVLKVGQTWDPMLGVTATDKEDGTVSVTLTGDVDTSTPGDYWIFYSAEDSNAAGALVIMQVRVAP